MLPSPLDVQIDWRRQNHRAAGYRSDLQRGKESRGKESMGRRNFCIEIVSDSSRKRDYGIKVQKYMNAGVRGILDHGPKEGKDCMLLVRG